MNAKNIVLFVPTGNPPAIRCPNATLALPSLELMSKVVSIPRPQAGPTNRLAAFHHEWRQTQLWETVGFGALAVCGVTTTVLAVLRGAALM